MIYFCYPYRGTALPVLPDGARWIGGRGDLSVGHLDVENAGSGSLALEVAGLVNEWDVVVPVTEEAVLPVVAAARETGARSMGWGAALACTYRARQREVLPPELSPEWMTVPFEGHLKRATSEMGQGVLHIHRDDARLAPWMDGPFESILERHIDGPQFEITVLVDGAQRIRCGVPLRQHWAGLITSYERCPEHQGDLVRVARKVVGALGLRWCAACLELRLSKEGWKVVEVNGRLGWDPDPVQTGYAKGVFEGQSDLEALVEHLTTEPLEQSELQALTMRCEEVGVR